jgi:3-deoxy-7-phosphoheptulonate synthase
VEELLASAEAILAGGNYDVVLCEAGIRTFAPGGVTLDMGAFPTIRKLSHLPVIADPCQGEEARSVIAALSRAAIAAGADGLSIRVDSSDLGQFAELMQSIRNVAAAVERRA